ncbi:Hypothetical predicted protein [Mytilus galloprovincialis]|uniref:Integrase catalytic domain-containing protein n=1 Tax=Mytilus galloprovincialis TaxID=29158 RepID=A0A8B6ELB4_MYTGA|nr:Hypothetical predicted protein [Mytilus galloprovincialis]
METSGSPTGVIRSLRISFMEMHRLLFLTDITLDRRLFITCYLAIKSDEVPSTSFQEPVDYWLSPRSEKEIREAQLTDKDLNIIIKWLETDSAQPKWSEVLVHNTSVKTLRAKWKQLILHKGILYINQVDEDSNTILKRLIIPKIWRDEVLRMLHNDPGSGHLGVARTLARTKSRVYWPDITRDVNLWCKMCLVCQSRKRPARKARGGLGQYAVGAPMERIGMDLLGPLPQSRQGNKYILIVSDYFTRWIEAYPIPDIHAHTICRVFIAEFISRYGIPRQIHTDRGTQFTSQLFKEICDTFRIDKTFTTSLHPQSDGLVERFNRTVEDMLSKVVSRDQKKLGRSIANGDASISDNLRIFNCPKCDQSYDLISQLKRHHSDRHGPRLKCNTEGCIFTCPESRRYMLRNHMSEQHSQYITAPMVNSEKYPLSPLRSPTPISLYEPSNIHETEFDFLYQACQESDVNIDFEPPRKILIQEKPNEKGDANNNPIPTAVSLKPRDLTSEYLMCPVSPEISTYFTCSAVTQSKNTKYNLPTTKSVQPVTKTYDTYQVRSTSNQTYDTYLFSQLPVARWK